MIVTASELAGAVTALRPRPITMRQRKVLRLIATACVNGDDSPTVRGLAAGTGLTSSTVFHHLRELEDRGLITSRPGRRLDITPAGRMELDGAP